MINGLLEDEKYQREAFKAMFLAQDARNKEISAQVESIQQELASLSMVEMTKTNMKVIKLDLLILFAIVYFLNFDSEYYHKSNILTVIKFQVKHTPQKIKHKNSSHKMQF